MKNATPIPVHARLVMQDLISGIVKIKVGMVRGVYITGSIPLNDFQPGKSDIDFVILCDELPMENLQKQLEKLHKKVERRHKTNLGGSFIINESLDECNAEKTRMLSYHEG
ncbi:MAG: nucleotidyltransferase domain-containing protein, partial [Flavisolibacter sp.]